jgi:sugar phosphate isomerase/epimerase
MIGASMTPGFHTDAFNSAYWSFSQCVDWGAAHGLAYIECGAIDGVSWIHGLGYQPHIALWEDPLKLRDEMERRGVRLSQLDAAFPLSRPEGATLGVEYILHAIRWAHLAGCACIDTTDDRFPPAAMSETEAMAHMRRCYQQVVAAAERYGVVINIEPHGHFTTNPDRMEEMLAFVDSPALRMNFDSGNTFIAGQDPAAFLRRFSGKVSHVHIKDVSASLAAAARGGLTGIAVSHCAIGEGVNADNIRACLRLLKEQGYAGVLSLECEGQGGPMLERSLAWVRRELEALA